MEGPNKRRRLNENYLQRDEEAFFASNGVDEYRDGRSQESNHFSGQGISNRNGKVEVGRDFVGTVLSLKKSSNQVLTQGLSKQYQPRQSHLRRRKQNLA